ncbi:AAA family ATPase [Cytobacillus sp. FSL K6-0129]|uniref:ATP-binding protein n=1 Tax=Cytobacillus sp. FSL K6-0129 TaxID=2921421 RepID=UPI0030F7B4B3
MKLKGMEIYGYGKWENIKIKQLNDFHCFYGQNEAGKSTLMSFIHSMLFGFPSKKGNERNYKPKNSSQYGGKLIFTLPDGHEAMIERVKERTPDEVNVVLSSGRSGGSTLLEELLQGMDQPLYRAIFSFDLFDIQNVQSFSKEDLGHFLFSSAVVGTDGILKAEQYLQKQLDLRFKPSGTKPVLNSGLKELKKAYENLKKAEKTNNLYKERTEKKEELIYNNELLEQEVEQLEGMLSSLRKWFTVEEVYLHYLSLLDEESQLDVDEFPIDGLKQLEAIQQSKEVLEDQRNELIMKRSTLDEKLMNAGLQKQILENRAEIEAVCELNTVRENQVQTKNEWQLEIKALEEELQHMSDKLHMQISDEEILSFDTSMFQKELISNVMKKKSRLSDRKVQLDEESETIRTELNGLENKINESRKKLLSREERANILKQITTFEQKESHHQRLTEINVNIQLLTEKHKQAITKDKRSQKIEYMKISSLLLLFIFIGIWGFFEASFLIQALAIGGICITFISSFFKQKAVYSDGIKDELDFLRQQKVVLEKQEPIAAKEQVDEWKQQIERDKEQEAEVAEYARRLDYVNSQYEKIIAAYEVWEGEMREVDSKIDLIAEPYRLNKSTMKNQLLDAFLLIEEMKGTIRKRKIKKAKLDDLSQSITNIEEKLSHYFSLVVIEPRSYADGVIQLKDIIDKERNKLANFEKNKEIRESIQSDITIIDEKIANREKHIQSLLEEAGVSSIIAFKEKGMAAKRKQAIKEELRTEKLKLNMTNLSQETLNKYVELRPTEEQIKEYQISIDTKKERITKQQEILHHLSYEIKQLEEGGIYAELLHKYKQLKAEWNELAKEWAVYATAKSLLSETVNTFKEEEFPKILKKAERYFSDLTLGQYKRIFYDSDKDHLLLEHKEGMFFEPRSLSQSTAEQLYISLRLSLAEIVFHRYQLPFIIDDGFVNFDHKRLEEVMRVLRGKEEQIIFFTCHKGMLQSFNGDELIDLSELQTATSF